MVSAAGVTLAVPVELTVPIRLSMLMESAPETHQESVEELPEMIASGSAEKLSMAGASPSITTVTLFTLEPAALVAVSI